ncbi:unnamed protein product [Urochloa humidicola]
MRRKLWMDTLLMDGVVTDFQETVTAIIKASDFPMSIIVIGVGGTNFKGMRLLSRFHVNVLYAAIPNENSDTLQ